MTSPNEPQGDGGANNQFADECRRIDAWVNEALEEIARCKPYLGFGLRFGVVVLGPNLDDTPSGKRILASQGEASRRLLAAALWQIDTLGVQILKLLEFADDDEQQRHPFVRPDWRTLSDRQKQVITVVRALLRRTLDLQREDVHRLLRLWNHGAIRAGDFIPIGSVVRALEHYGAANPLDGVLLTEAKTLAADLRMSGDKADVRLAPVVEQICADVDDPSGDDELGERLPPPRPAPVGEVGVLKELKRYLGILPADESPATEPIGPDEFPLAENSPLRSAHVLLSDVFVEALGAPRYANLDVRQLKASQRLLEQPIDDVGRSLLAAYERRFHGLLTNASNYDHPAYYLTQHVAWYVIDCLSTLAMRFSREGSFDVLLFLTVFPGHRTGEMSSFIQDLLERLEQSEDALSEGERYVLSLYRASCIKGPALVSLGPFVTRLNRLIGDGAQFCLVPGEVWTDAVNDEARELSADERARWMSLFAHVATATSARPSKKWLKTSAGLVDALGADRLHACLERWLPLVAQGQSVRRIGAHASDTRSAADTIDEQNATCLRGLLWIVPTLPRGNALLRAVTAVALSAYKKVPGVGPRAVKVGNAAVYALSQFPSTDAVGQLAMLKVRVKFGTAQKEIEKAFTTTAEALGLARDDIEEMGIPAYGLEAGGHRQETLGDYTADVVVTGADAHLEWHDAKGKLLKSVPAKVRKEHKEDLKELQQSLKDIQGMLPAQRDRIDSMFLLQKSWPLETWTERYLEHPLVGTIARRLIWCVDGEPALFVDGTLTDREGKPLAPAASAVVTLWHPVGRSIEEITGWRQRLEALAITQPFKQAHREVYLLTDAERNTRTYSNRYAAHVLRQHQFNALCAARGWRNRLRLMVDDFYEPPLKELPQWNLRAEFWVEGLGDGYGTDTNDAGVFLRLATDQVRFYRTGAAANHSHAGGGGYTTHAAGPGQGDINAPLPLEEVPPLVFSEIMRDVDLFVGVASIGNDPTWQDGGPEGRFLMYWQSYSFGELSGTAATRKQVLERLVPRLKIADRCSFSDRFLVVRGDKRTYKIHLGSGNILMEPNDQYLCIVPDARSRGGQEGLFLPFEGDSTLSIILSKAVLLAEDTKIKDPTITRQIDGR